MGRLLRVYVVIYFSCVAAIGLTVALAPSLPNTLLAFADCEHEAEVYISDWSHGLQFNLSNNPANWDWRPTWSPDGHEIAFQVDREGNTAIFVTDLNTNTLYTLTNISERVMSPAWSPNGDLMAFVYSSERGPSPIVVADLTTGVIREFAATTSPSFPPAWSPNGQYVAFMDYGAGQPEIFILDVNTGQSRNISNNFEASEGVPIWSPDGTELAFTSTRGGLSQVYVVDVETSTVRALSTDTSVQYSGSAWSPDGQYIATVANNQQVHILNTFGDVAQTFDMQQIPRPIYDVNWSPDGSYLAIAAGNDPNQGDYLIDTASGAVNTVSFTACDSAPVAWAPNQE